MKYLLVAGLACFVGSIGCGSNNNAGTGGTGGSGGGGNSGTGGTTGDECLGAPANELVGTCTTDLVCVESYVPYPPSESLIKAFSDGCSGTWATGGKCARAAAECACNNTLYREGRSVSFYTPSSISSAFCSACSGRCYELL
jgi:hypothetical protein